MLYQRLVKFFETGWFAARNDAQTFLRLVYAGSNGGEWVCYAQAYEDEQVFVFYSVLPTQVEASRRMLIAELLTRINFGLKLGNFELDLADGEVRYKTSVMLENAAWENAVIRPVVFYNLSMMDRYWPALQALLNNTSSPQEALALIEQNDFPIDKI